jgi:bifunctional non-homologous end joining protein LigD
MRIISPMLAEKIDNRTAVTLANSDNHAGERKVDGHRLLMHVDEGKIVPVSRTGKTLRCSMSLIRAFQPFADGGNRWVFDGEYLDQTYYIFDLIEAADMIEPNHEFELRRQVLETFLGRLDLPANVVLLPSYRATEDKIALIKQVHAENGEGVVFKRLDAPYLCGKRSLHFAKLKFRHEIDCIVVDRNRGAHNFVLALWDPANPDKPIEVGEVSALTGDKDRIRVGDVVTVTYLYATAERRLFQPVFPRIRVDKLSTECTVDQLVYPTKTITRLT